ncbi:polyphosphate:nucleotide phosphotransferase, PPK2 family [Cohnella sp. OV330]|uniref:PPK2 family polyphosphate kinase n=1 Tax=Cohnella sp. OV330 TaxID=1855288 RepID=UPI0008E20FFC|nr:PPK2 family polyphosphate kinase [Cohnella sp. OV330]SFB07190.1 polyphosphate:nucleotide phosphotransferase, PPK2 family [Cohnella sp. OV330]
MADRTRLDRKRHVSLKDFDPRDTGDIENKEQVEAEIEDLRDRLQEAQEKLYASRSHGVLIVFQGMDCSGKDGTVKKVLSALNPQGYRAESFKTPTAEEASHDFLWRTHKLVPQKGYIASFNRSYYEEVLITRVHGNIDKKETARRLEHIKNFEKLLADSGVLVIKIFLHISKEFQLEKLHDRLTRPEKLWKFDPNDLKERQHWDEYVRAYEDVFEATGTKRNPWHIVPADKRWYRDYRVLKIITEAFESLDLAYPKIDIERFGELDLDDETRAKLTAAKRKEAKGETGDERHKAAEADAAEDRATKAGEQAADEKATVVGDERSDAGEEAAESKAADIGDERSDAGEEAAESKAADIGVKAAHREPAEVSLKTAEGKTARVRRKAADGEAPNAGRKAAGEKPAEIGETAAPGTRKTAGRPRGARKQAPAAEVTMSAAVEDAPIEPNAPKPPSKRGRRPKES